jgi:hypothetical protein
VNPEDKKLRDALVQPLEQATQLAQAQLGKTIAANVMHVEPGHVGTAQVEYQSAKAGRKKAVKKLRGIFEKVRGSEIWWVRYHGAHGRLRRQKAGTKGMAQKLSMKRK